MTIQLPPLPMVDIPAGTFMMGSNERVNMGMGRGERAFESPIHEVKVNAFKIGKYPVTHEAYQAVMGAHSLESSSFASLFIPYAPVCGVSWTDAQNFCKELNKLTSQKYRLPTEAEWEYACRAGTQTRYFFGDDENRLGEYAWYKGNSDRQPHTVGQKKPNGWELYDMYGNVWEWCEDAWYENYQNAPKDGTAWKNKYSPNRVKRGGSCVEESSTCRSAFRFNGGYLGSDFQSFRVVSS